MRTKFDLKQVLQAIQDMKEAEADELLTKLAEKKR